MLNQAAADRAGVIASPSSHKWLILANATSFPLVYAGDGGTEQRKGCSVICPKARTQLCHEKSLVEGKQVVSLTSKYPLSLQSLLEWKGLAQKKGTDYWKDKDGWGKKGKPHEGQTQNAWLCAGKSFSCLQSERNTEKWWAYNYRKGSLGYNEENAFYQREQSCWIGETAPQLQRSAKEPTTHLPNTYWPHTRWGEGPDRFIGPLAALQSTGNSSERK